MLRTYYLRFTPWIRDSETSIIHKRAYHHRDTNYRPYWSTHHTVLPPNHPKATCLSWLANQWLVSSECLYTEPYEFLDIYPTVTFNITITHHPFSRLHFQRGKYYEFLSMYWINGVDTFSVSKLAGTSLSASPTLIHSTTQLATAEQLTDVIK